MYQSHAAVAQESGLLPVFGRLIKMFNHRWQPKSHAVDLVDTLHVVLRMLDRLNSQGERNLPLTPAQLCCACGVNLQGERCFVPELTS